MSLDTNVIHQAGLKTFNCPNCGGTITVKHLGDTVAASCQHCQSIIDVRDDQRLKLIQVVDYHTQQLPIIPLGSRGKIKNITWEVMGYLVRDNQWGAWEEYLLFNPYHGFAWLIQSEGHWSFGRPYAGWPTPTIKSYCVELPTSQPNQKKNLVYFSKYATYPATVQYVVGEFNWQVKIGETSTCEDLIFPPYTFTQESSETEIHFTLSEYLEADTIAEAFSVEQKRLPKRKGVAPNQPNPWKARENFAWLSYILFVAILLVWEIIFFISAPNVILHQQNVSVFSQNQSAQLAPDNPDDDQTVNDDPQNLNPSSAVPAKDTTEKFAPPFKIENEKDNIEVKLSAPALSNDWLQVSFILNHEETGKTYDWSHNIEYYEGYDGSESWSEGYRSSSKFFTGLPPGTYQLSFKPNFSDKNNFDTYTILVKKNVGYGWVNWIIFSLLGGLMPL